MNCFINKQPLPQNINFPPVFALARFLQYDIAVMIFEFDFYFVT